MQTRRLKRLPTLGGEHDDLHTEHRSQDRRNVPSFPYDQAKWDAIQPSEAIKLVKALRLPDEPTWLQTFADGPKELYTIQRTTGRNGRPYTLKTFSLADVPKAGGKRAPVTGRTERTGSYTLDELGVGLFERDNLARVGVFFTVNVLEPGAQRRSADTVARVAAVFLDLDGAPLPAEGFPLQPTAIVESSPDRFHVYWAVHDLDLSEFTTVQKHLAGLYGGDASVSDLPRVMRLPGYWHGKQNEGFLSRLLELNEAAQYTRADLLGNFDGLAGALETAALAEARRLQTAADQQTRAAELRVELASGPATSQADAQRKYGETALLDEVGKLASAEQGGRNNQLFKSAAALGECVAAGVLDQSTVKAELTAAALAVGLDQHETADTLQNGLSKGMKNPRDLSDVGTRAGKSAKKEKAASGLHLAARTLASGPDLPSADQIPAPEGEGGSYSDGQLTALLGLSWPVVDMTSDTAHGYRLHALAGDDLAYVAELGGYLAWDGRQWLSGGKDGAGQIEAKRHVQRLGVFMRPETERLLSLHGVLNTAAVRASADHGADSKEFKQLRTRADAMEKAYFAHTRAAKRTEGDSKQAAILNSAKTLYVKDVHLFELRPWVVGFQNGVWDKGEFRAAQREDHMLTLAAVDYHPDANRGDWLEVLERITGGDADLALTLQDVAGYGLSGASSLRLVPWLYGEGGTGKSTFDALVSTVLGDMATTVDPKLLATDASRERLGAAIWGKRVATVAEAGNSRLDAEALKMLSGGDRLSVRMLYAEVFTARASHVLLMVANDAPRVEAYDDALKERVLALPFSHRLDAGVQLLSGRRLEEVRQNPKSALLKGFTAWAVEGLTRVHATGSIHRAAVCVAATRAFWNDVDPLHDFWLLCKHSELVLNGVPVAEFRAAYEQWAKDNGLRPSTAQKFNKAARSVGLEQKYVNDKRCWKLIETEKFPGESEADQGAQGSANGNTGFVPISQKPITSSLYEREKKGFRENGLKSVFPLASQEGSAGEDFAPASGEV